MTFGDIAHKLEKFAIDNSPSLLTGVGAVGVISTAVLAVRAGYRVGLDRGKYRYEDDSLRNQVEVYWREFVPPAVVGTVTIAAVIGANHIGGRRAAAVAAAYSISEKTFAEYKAKVVEKVGENKERDVRDSVAQDRVTRTSDASREVIISGSEVLCMDMFSGRYFTSDMETLKKAQNDLNYQILNDSYASLTDFYNKVGLSSTAYSEEVGWNCDKMVDLKFSTCLTDDQRPCITVDFSTAPIRDYYKLH